MLPPHVEVVKIRFVCFLAKTQFLQFCLSKRSAVDFKSNIQDVIEMQTFSFISVGLTTALDFNFGMTHFYRLGIIVYYTIVQYIIKFNTVYNNQKQRKCTFIVELVQEGLQLVEPFISFHLDIRSSGDFCKAEKNSFTFQWIFQLSFSSVIKWQFEPYLIMNILLKDLSVRYQKDLQTFKRFDGCCISLLQSSNG